MPRASFDVIQTKCEVSKKSCHLDNIRNSPLSIAIFQPTWYNRKYFLWQLEMTLEMNYLELDV